MPERTVFDCCVISNFALAGALRVIEELYPRFTSGKSSAVITSFVSAEILRGVQAGHAELATVRAAIHAGRVAVVELESAGERTLFESLSISLGLGEASSLVVARYRGWRLATDDTAARREARALSIVLTGTVGILRKAVELRICDERTAERYLRKMIGRGFYSPVKSLKTSSRP